MAKKKPQVIPVSERALMGRIQRKLKPENEVLRKSRPGREYNDLGDYFIINGNNMVFGSHLDLESLGRELEVLRPYEKLE